MSPKENPTILIVDDRPENREYLRTLLGYFPFTLLEASDGALGYRLADEHHPDLVITDISMPECSGVEMVRRMRSNDLLKRVPVIVYSATFPEPVVREFLTEVSGWVALRKPAEPDAILETVGRQLGMDLRPPG